MDGAKHRYTPDILVVWGTHREVVEIKDDAEADLPESQQRFELFQELLGEHEDRSRGVAKIRFPQSLASRMSDSCCAIDAWRYRHGARKHSARFCLCSRTVFAYVLRNQRNCRSKRTSNGTRRLIAYELVGTNHLGFNNKQRAPRPPGMAFPSTRRATTERHKEL